MSDMNDMERWHAYGNENGDGPWNDDIDPGYEVGICQNCDAQLTLQQARRGKLFCSEKCQQTAKTVRYGRATLLDGRYKRDPLVRQAIDIRIAIILGGGYPKKARTLSHEQREAIFTRDGRRCRLCGAPATDIDHIAGSSSDLENFRLSANLATWPRPALIFVRPRQRRRRREKRSGLVSQPNDRSGCAMTRRNGTNCGGKLLQSSESSLRPGQNGRLRRMGTVDATD